MATNTRAAMQPNTTYSFTCDRLKKPLSPLSLEASEITFDVTENIINITFNFYAYREISLLLVTYNFEVQKQSTRGLLSNFQQDRY